MAITTLGDNFKVIIEGGAGARFAGLAEASANASTIDADRAESARDIAQAAVGVDYADATAALAGAVNGDKFTYWDGDEIIYSTKTGGVLVELVGPWIGAEKIGFTQSGTGAVARDAQSKMRERRSFDDFGAVGDGVTDDTAAIQNALNTGLHVHGSPGKTYLTGPLTQNTAGQVIDLTGCTLKLKAGSNFVHIWLQGERAKVRGGTIDGNKAAGQVAIDGGYNLACIYLGAKGAQAEKVMCINSGGIAIKGGQFDDLKANGNIVEDWTLHGIYFETPTADSFNWEANGNYVVVGANTGVGIYLCGSQDNPTFTHRPKEWSCCNNRVVGPTAGTTVKDICITIHGDDGVCNNNITTGGDMAISADITASSTFIGNRCTGMNGPTAYGLELNGAGNTVNGNVVLGGKYSFVASGPLPLNDNTIVGNRFAGASMALIYITPKISTTARNNLILGNTLIVLSATAVPILLERDCKSTQIKGNSFTGPGSGTGCRAVVTDGGSGFLSITSNRFQGFERVLLAYNGGAVPQTNVQINDNDCSVDMQAETAWFLVDGGATVGDYCQQRNNMVTTGARRDWLDRKNNIIDFTFDQSPEGIISAGVGSRVWRTTGGAATTLYVKESGTGNTGWIGK